MSYPNVSYSYRIATAATLVACVFAYWTSLGGGFLFDDFYNLLDNAALRSIGTPAQDWLAVALSSDAGVLRRPISMLSFGFNVAAFGMNPWAFKAVNLLIHLINGVLVYALARLLTNRLVAGAQATPSSRGNWIALLVAALWLLHPLQVSTVAYIVQRMTELAALFTLCGLLWYADARMKMLRGESELFRGLAGLCAFALLAILSKENGALIFAFAWVIELTCFRFEIGSPTQRRALKAFYWLTLALPIVLLIGYLATHPDWMIRAYSVRDFSLLERLLTEPRILWEYLLWIFVPNPNWMGLYHDDIAISRQLLAPITTVFALVFLIALSGSAWILRRRFPAFAFAAGWFLVGHAMESTILPLELVFEHRNYLPMVGLILGAACIVAPKLQAHLSSQTCVAAGLALVVVLASLTTFRARQWSNPLSLALTDVRNHPESARMQYEAGRAIIIAGAQSGARDQAETKAIPHFERAVLLDPGQIHAIVELLLIEAKRGPVSASTWNNLRERIARLSYYPQLNPFLDMLVEASKPPMALPAEKLSGLVEAALANPHLPPKVRAMVLNNFGAYQFNILHDPQRAVSLTLAAAAEDPRNPYFEFNIAQIALASGQYDIAREHLDKTEGLDKTGHYAPQIKQLRQQIETVQPIQSGAPAKPGSE